MINIQNSFPVFIVTDLAAAKAFYLSFFDFSIAFANQWYLHLISPSGVQIGFMLPDQPTQPEIFHNAHPGHGTIFSMEVENADLAYASARESSLDIVLQLRSEDWGQRHFSICDPNGLYLDIVQAIAPSAEYQQGYSAQ